MRNSRNDALKEQVRKGKLSECELIALYKNADRLGEAELQALIVERMRADFPRAANRLFGAKTPEAVSRLEEIYSRVSAKFVLASNKLGNGVKAGGNKRSGEKYIGYYLSYKNASNEGTALSLTQDTEESELKATVSHYKTGKGSFKQIEEFGMHDFEKAVALYEKHLEQIVT